MFNQNTFVMVTVFSLKNLGKQITGLLRMLPVSLVVYTTTGNQICTSLSMQSVHYISPLH